jgi:hypothetical protein
MKIENLGGFGGFHKPYPEPYTGHRRTDPLVLVILFVFTLPGQKDAMLPGGF